MIPNIPPKHNIFSTSLQTYKNLSSPCFPTEPFKKGKKNFQNTSITIPNVVRAQLRQSNVRAKRR